MNNQKLTQHSTLTFSSGRSIPRLGFGTYKLQGKKGVQGIITALHNGYTSLDTASLYKNQAEVKQAIQKAGIPRNKLFVTSKVGDFQMGKKQSREAVEGILKRLGFDYLDLVLIHWPASDKLKEDDKQNQKIRLQTWETLIQLQKQGKIKDIGVSNFLTHHLQHLLKNSDHKPVLNQIQVHPLLWQSQTIQFCRKNNIIIQAYASIGHGKSSLPQNKTIHQIAKNHNKTWAQVCLRWALQNDFVIIPKSNSEQRIKQNMNIYDFELSEEEMGKIQKQTIKMQRTCSNPHKVKY